MDPADRDFGASCLEAVGYEVLASALRRVYVTRHSGLSEIFQVHIASEHQIMVPTQLLFMPASFTTFLCRDDTNLGAILRHRVKGLFADDVMYDIFLQQALAKAREE